MATHDIRYANVEGPGIRRVRWDAIIAGTLIALVTQFLLSLFGLAVGLTALDPAAGDTLEGFGIGSGIWLIVQTLISVFVGAWAAGWWSSAFYKADAILHGVLTWSLLMLVMLFMLGSGLGSITGGAFALLNSSVTGAAQGVAMRPAAATSPNAVNQIQQRLGELMPTTGPAGKRLADADVSGQIRNQISQRIAAGDEQGAAQLLSQHSGMSQQEALNTVRSSQVETREVAQQVTDTASRITWVAFLTVLLSLGAAALGGLTGQRSRGSHMTPPGAAV